MHGAVPLVMYHSVWRTIVLSHHNGYSSILSLHPMHGVVPLVMYLSVWRTDLCYHIIMVIRKMYLIFLLFRGSKGDDPRDHLSLPPLWKAWCNEQQQSSSWCHTWPITSSAWRSGSCHTWPSTSSAWRSWTLGRPLPWRWPGAWSEWECSWCRCRKCTRSRGSMESTGTGIEDVYRIKR